MNTRVTISEVTPLVLAGHTIEETATEKMPTSAGRKAAFTVLSRVVNASWDRGGTKDCLTKRAPYRQDARQGEHVAKERGKELSTRCGSSGCTQVQVEGTFN
ncbi:MAG TPA: hypothetical protein VIY29_24600 [Ktedonobacteraceae bacterium]